MAESIVARQRRDHAQLDALLLRYQQQTPQERRKTFREIVQLVTTHAFAEEEVLFPAARKVLGARGEALTTLIESEHQRVNELLVELQGREPGEDGFEARVAQLFPLLRDDARNEEDRLLPELARQLDSRALERLGAAWALAKKAAPNRPHPGISRRPPGNVLAGIPLYLWDRGGGLLTKLARVLGRARAHG